MRIVVALGGNALLRRGEKPDSAVQRMHIGEAATALAELATEHEVVLVHGNGPQVGMLALENAADQDLTRPYPFSDLVAQTQGVIGYWLQQALGNAGLTKPVVTMVTQTLVAAADPAFERPTKFVGRVYPEPEARVLADRNGWVVHPDAGGRRRVVPSPVPQRIVEIETARFLLEHGTIVIIAGGGGVPVVEGPEGLTGVDAVVDKDLAAALIATTLDADLLVLLTDVAGVLTGYRTPQQQVLRAVTGEQLQRMTFPAGSMGPKVAAVCQFVRQTAGRAAIGALGDVAAVIDGSAGTQVTRVLTAAS